MLAKCWLTSLIKQQDYTRNPLEEERGDSLTVPHHQCELYWHLGAFLASLSLGYSYSIAVVVILCYHAEHTFLHYLLKKISWKHFSVLSQEWADLNKVEVGEGTFSGKERAKVKSPQWEEARGQ